MKTILLCTALAFVGCKKGGAGDCAGAVGKGVDTMMAAGAKRLEAAPPEMQAEMKSKMDEASVKLKGVMTNRCTEDKWSADVIDCYAKATKREDLRDCRGKLPPEAATKLQKEEMEVMAGFGGGMMRGGGHNMGMGSGAQMHPDSLQPNTGSAVAAPAMGSATAPAMGSATGSAK